MTRILISVLDNDAKTRAQGFKEAMLAQGVVNGASVMLDPVKMMEVYKQFPEPKTEVRGLGDVVERIAHPIAKALGVPCIDKTTDRLKPESPCAKRRDWLNRVFPKP